MTDTQGIWLYAVTRQVDPAVLGRLPGVAGETPRVVDEAGLVAVVGDVPLSAFGEEALHRNFEDVDWLGGVARAHDAVIVALLAGGPVVPIQLATVYRDDDGVRRVLRCRAPDFDHALERVTGRTEWGVKVFLEAAAEPGTSHGGPSRGGAGTAYLAQRRAALASREHREQRAIEQAHRVHSALAALAVDARMHRPHSQTLAGGRARMILNAAYLVDDDTRDFLDAVAACEQDNDTIRVQLTGPWPPYSFSSLEQT